MPAELILVLIAGVAIGLSIGWLADVPFMREAVDYWTYKFEREERKSKILMQWIRRNGGS